MAHSLIIANQIELIGEVPSTNPRCLGAIFRISSGTGATSTNLDLGAPQPTTDFVASLLLDGERPFGRRSSNRTIKLPISINAPSTTALAGAMEVLQAAVDQDMWILQWTRDPGQGNPQLPLFLDCFRAEPSVPVYDLKDITQCYAEILLTIPALPYGRSNIRQQLQFQSPVPAAPPPPPAPVVLDDYSTISSSQFQQSSQCVVGSHSGFWDPDFFGDPGGQVSQLSYSSVFTSTLNLTSMTSLQFYFGLGTRYYHHLEHHGVTEGVEITINLVDATGNVLSITRNNLRIPVSPVVTQPCFSLVTVPIPQGSTVFQYGAVVSYSMTITNRRDFGNPRLSNVSAYINALTAYPSTQTVQPVSRGFVHTIYGLVGTARAPMALSFQQLPSPGTPTTITAPGIGNYTVPALTAYAKAEVWAAGGPGSSRTSSGFGGGGGSGGYSRENVFACAPGDIIPYSIGLGGTPGNDGGATYFGPGPASPVVVTANPGRAAPANSITGGLGGLASGNSVSFAGAAGRTASGSVGGGGASSAGPTSAGQTPVGTAAVTLTGAGNWTAPLGVSQIYVECWAPGGSGGCGGPSTNGSGGGAGEYVGAYVNVVGGNSYAYSCGTGGALVNGSSINGHPGSGSTTFIGANGTVTANPGGAGLGTSYPVPGGAGGSGGSFSGGPYVEFPGGNGGASNPYPGSGGSSGSAAGAGNNGVSTGTSSTPAPAGGGAGGASSGPTSNPGQAGTAPGGGGGGTYNNGVNSGAGANGQIRITYPGGAPTNNGAAAVSGGGAGGNGGGSANTPGSNGANPGGGGGGADSGGTTETGGNGGNGQLTVTPYSSAAFKTLLLHRPPLGCNPNFQPLVGIGNGSDVPNGGTQYTMPQPVSGVPADFGGTYSIYAVNKTWSGSGSRTVTVTVTQKETATGASHSASTIPVTFTPAQVTNGFLLVGVLTLPVWRLAPDNTGAVYTVSINDTVTADRFYDLIFVDTQGQTILINEPTTGYVNYYVDIPDPNVNLGNIMGSQSGRPNAISVLDQTTLSGVCMFLEPADCINQLFVYSADAAAGIAIAVEYYPHWFFDRSQ